ncbi:hypothetical protein Cantr_04358 [Candida viswanathii]|uniref:Protein BNI4 n=1 Tax=Candida viswanathii TaxID=5486 RepID=A0A367XLS7_9ASCO|nr:hypothetical protein Cantr_04358 [Candida viswanathii]
MSGHHSRRNSMTSLATANTTASSQNNISGHDLSTDNLIAVDSKFVKKPTKKFPNSNGLSPKLINDSTLRSGGGNNNNNSSGSAFYAKEGVYYFPNGEVFRPRTTPAKRNRPSKLQQDISPNDSGNSSPVVPPLNPNTSLDSPTSQHSSNSSTNSGTTSSMAAPSLHSNNSHSSLPKSASIQNVKMMNKHNLVQNIRNSRGDITTNIVLDDNSAKIPYENYRNSNSSSSLKNSHKFQSQNITKTEQYSNTSSFSSQTSNASNVSDLLADHDDEHSNANLNRSATNTPSTSISDDHNRLSNEIRNSTGSSSDEGNHPPETVTDDTALSTLNETSEETFRSVPAANLGSSSAGHSANSSWDNKSTPEPHRLARNESNSSFSPSERQHALRTRNMQHQPMSTSSPASSSPHLTIGTDSPGSGYGNTPSSAYGNTPSSGYGQTPSSGYGHTPSSVYDSIAPLEVVKQRAPNNSGSNSPNSLYDSSNPASIHRLGAPMKPILRDISRTSELSSEEEVFKTPVSTPDREVFREFKGTPTMTPTSPTSVKTATPTITPPSNINTFRPPRISAGSLLHFERLNTDTSSSTNSSSSGGTSNRKSQISLLPEPTIDTESFVEQYFNESSPELYQLSEIISNLNSTPTKQHHQQQQQLLEREKMAHEQEEYTKHINEKRQLFQLTHQLHVPPKEQVIQVTDEQSIKFVPSPSNSKTDTPRSSRYYDIDSSTFNKFVNDTQMDIPPRGDVMIVSNKKIRKHSRNASSTSSANDFFINSANNSQTAANTSANPGPSTPKRSPIQEVITPQNPESPPPPPPIEKSPGMRVKGRPKKRRPRKDGEHKSDKKNADESHHATRLESKPRDQDEEVSQRKGSDHSHKVESEEFTIPIAIQTQPIKRKNTEQPVTPVLAVAPNLIFKNEDEERDPSPSKLVLYDTPRTLQEQQAQEMRELEEKSQPPKAPEPTTPVKKSAKPIRSLLLNDESIQDKKLPMGPNFKPPNATKTVKKTSSMPSMGPEKPPLIPDALLPSSDKQHQSSTTHRRFEPSRPPPEINDKNRLTASKSHQAIGKAPPPPSSTTTPVPAPAPATTTSRPRLESNLAIPHPPPPPPLQPPTIQPQAQSPQPNMKRHVYHSPKFGDDGNNKKGAGGSGTNLKSFFKMFKPHSQEKSMDKSNSTTSLSSSGSSSSKLFKFMKPKKEEQEMTDLPIIVEQSKLGPPVTATTNGNRISVLSEIAPSIKLGSLPDFEPEETGLFDELMMTFDEKFESELTPTSPPAFIHKISTNRSSMNEPFLRDDELSIDQIKDQQLKDDDAANNGGTGTIGGYSININDENYAENMAFLKSEAYWATMDEGAIKNHIDKNLYTIDEETNPEIRKFREGLMAAANVVPPPDISMTSSEAGISTPVDDSFHQPAVGPPQIPRAPNAPVTDEDIDPVLVDDDLSQEGESIVIDNQELHYIFNNLTDDEKRNLPPHLKYIRQFKDYQSIEVNMKKFEDLSKIEFSVDEDGKSGPILKRRRRGGNGKKSMLDSGNGSRRVVFSNKISINETFASDMYKRYNKAVTQYSLNDPKEINKIKNELNYYKCNEMLVHESSQNNTHFFY